MDRTERFYKIDQMLNDRQVAPDSLHGRVQDEIGKMAARYTS